MSLPLEGKTAIVTGSSRGIGKAIALQLAADGANVVICARTETSGELPGSIAETAAAIESIGHGVLSVRCDVTDDGDIRSLLDQTLARFGKLDVLVNNAGGAGGAWSFLTDDIDRLDYNYRLNLRAPFLLSQLAGTKMAEAGGGAIINLTSGAARNAAPPAPGSSRGFAGFNITYGTTKAALDRWATGIAGELLDKNIAVINVNPGFTVTERVLANPGGADLSRAERPETTAKVISFLCQDPMRYTGQILTARAFFDEHKLG